MNNNELKLLIIEDTSNNIDSIRNALSDFGAFQRENIFPRPLEQEKFREELVQVVNNIDRLFKFIKEKINSLSIDAIVLDLNLNPGRNPESIMQSEGIQLVEKIKKENMICRIPIVILTVREDLDNIPVAFIAKGIIPLKKPTAVEPDAISRLFSKDVIDFLTYQCQ